MSSRVNEMEEGLEGAFEDFEVDTVTSDADAESSNKQQNNEDSSDSIEADKRKLSELRKKLKEEEEKLKRKEAARKEAERKAKLQQEEERRKALILRRSTPQRSNSVAIKNEPDSDEACMLSANSVESSLGQVSQLVALLGRAYGVLGATRVKAVVAGWSRVLEDEMKEVKKTDGKERGRVASVDLDSVAPVASEEEKARWANLSRDALKKAAEHPEFPWRVFNVARWPRGKSIPSWALGANGYDLNKLLRYEERGLQIAAVGVEREDLGMRDMCKDGHGPFSKCLWKKYPAKRGEMRWCLACGNCSYSTYQGCKYKK
ncbi:hypothetical protein BJ508DRAFT_311241 [Ascobolus immersus RN42]|uniref:Uncharacterized protein n=1 Tax=Ascobolus immersus RN42 TaxID=1160509 RepID=A0A3N4HTH2_ASCIM|nr:hypothetical protein BJ508DRAFT_311241 [Ascobolus immersus RN42]